MRRSRRWLRALAAGTGLCVAGAGCVNGTVRIAARPAVGDVSRYRISVRAVSVTAIGGEAPRRRTSTSVLVARHRVLASGPDGSRVEVRLQREGGDPTTFVARLDRAGQLVEVERIDGLPAGALGDLGLSEIFPAGAAAPPRHHLAPGDSWPLDGPVRIGDAANGGGGDAPPQADRAPARLEGRGRLVSLGVAGGRRLATVDSHYTLPVRRTAAGSGGRLALEGTLATRTRVAYDLDDKEVASVEAHSTGRYAVTLLPPAGVDGMPVPGTLTVNVSSTSRRVG